MKINKLVLENGLRVVHVQDVNTQMVAMNIVYDVGASDEDPQRTGFAHLFEHLMFGGSKHIPDYDTPLQLAGGENNAWTNNDITNYYLTIPSQNLETGFWLESDRMLELAFTPKSLEVQREVVIEEFKQRNLNQPYGDIGHLVRDLAYKVHPYAWPTIGKECSHIEQATMEEVKDFFFSHYAPNNAVLAVTGNVDWERVVALTKKWFGPIPCRKIKPRHLPQEPIQTTERRLTVTRSVPVDALYMTFHMCGRMDKDYHTYDLLSDILSNGQSSRLIRKLVQQEKVFSSIDAYISASRDPGLFYICGKPAGDITLEEAEKAIWNELELLKNESVSEEELEKVKNKFESTQIFSLNNYLNLATSLAQAELYAKAEDTFDEVKKYRAVTSSQIKEMACRLFRHEQACILYYKHQ